MSLYSKEILEQVNELLSIGIALSAEKNHKKLLERILSEARRITQCDAGTLYIKEEGYLAFKIIQNDTLKIYQGGLGEPIDLPPVEMSKTTVSGYCALEKEVINISDVYNTELEGIDFSGPKRYDSITGYKTVSMLVVPLEDHMGANIGVLQLLNAKNEEGKVIPFAHYFEQVVRSLGSQAAVSINNMRYLDEIDTMLHAFVRVISTAIDERSPYNANHTRNVARLAGDFANYLKNQNIISDQYLSDEDIDQLVMSSWLHDIGKIAIPLEIMDKPSRLGDRYEIVSNRMLTIREQLKVQAIKETLKKGQLEKELDINRILQMIATVEEEMHNICEILEKVNNPVCFVDEKLKLIIEELATRNWFTEDGEEKPWLMPLEVEALTVSCGTLTDKERRFMENHVNITKKMLDQIPFGSKYEKVPSWASAHHELLDGTGYPEQRKGDSLPIMVRILTIMDIYDALTARDRPYKKALPTEEAFSVLEDMAGKGKLDMELVSLFKESKIWA